MTIYGNNFGYSTFDTAKITINVYDANDCISACTLDSLNTENPQEHYVQCNYPQAGIASKSACKSKVQTSMFLTLCSEYSHRFYARC